MDVHCRMYIHRMGSLINIFCYIAPDRERERENGLQQLVFLIVLLPSEGQPGSVTQTTRDEGRMGIVTLLLDNIISSI